MTKDKAYRCVNCGKPAADLYKYYGPSVLKLTKCVFCNGITDKYVEYDAVIVMIDMVLISKEAQRHIIYNTEFKPYWKLLVILMLLETYGVWSTNSLITVGVNGILCSSKVKGNISEAPQLGSGNGTLLLDGWMTQALNTVRASVPSLWKDHCWAWGRDKADENDIFIWEKDFYIQFTAVVSGIAAFFLSTFICSKLKLLSSKNQGIAAFFLSTFICSKLKLLSSKNQVDVSIQIKAFSLANMSTLFTLPMLVWGNSETLHQTRALHYLLVWAYSFVVFYNVFTVVFESRPLQTTLVLVLSCIAKFQTTFYITPLLRSIVT